MLSIFNTSIPPTGWLQCIRIEQTRVFWTNSTTARFYRRLNLMKSLSEIIHGPCNRHTMCFLYFRFYQPYQQQHLLHWMLTPFLLIFPLSGMIWTVFNKRLFHNACTCIIFSQLNCDLMSAFFVWSIKCDQQWSFLLFFLCLFFFFISSFHQNPQISLKNT